MEYNIAVVEDERKEIERLVQLINGHKVGGNYTFKISTFTDAATFIRDFHAEYDLIFFDIQMPGINGMEAAAQIRKVDDKVVIVFVTQMIQYAVEGYGVHAFDFIVKPINRGSFSIKFDRILRMLEKNRDDRSVVVRNKDGYRQLKTHDILYVESNNHNLCYHLVTQENIVVRGAMTEAEKLLAEHHFCRCNSCYLVNLKHVKAIHGDYIVVGEEELKISQTRRRTFLCEFAGYVGGGAC